MEGQAVFLVQLAEELGVSTKTVRRAARTLGLPGRLERSRHGFSRVFGQEEAERVRAYIRRSAPVGEEPSAEEETSPKVVVSAPEPPVRTLSLPESLESLRPFLEQLLQSHAKAVADALAARLPAPAAPQSTPSPPSRFRPRVVAEVVLLGWVGLLAGVLGAVVLQRLADVGVVTLPAWWPIG